MSREAAKWTTTSVDLSELRENPTDFFDAQDVFASEVARNPILQPIYKKVTTEGFEYSDETRLEDIKSLVSSFKIFNTEIYPDDITELPLKEDMLSKIRVIQNYKPQGQGLRSKQYGKTLASTILAISEGKTPSEISEGIKQGAIAYEREITEQSISADGTAQYAGICNDLKRTKFTFLKENISYSLDFQNISEQPLSLEEYRRRFTEFNQQNSLGLSGEQIDYIMHSKDQGAYEGAGSQLVAMKALERNLGTNPDQKKRLGTSHLVDIGETGAVKIKTFIEKPLVDISNSTEEIATVGYTIESDISKLRGERLLVGISENSVPVQITFSSSHGDRAMLQVSGAISTTPSSHHIEEACKIRIHTSDTATLDKQVKLIANKTPEDLVPQMIASMAKIKGSDIEKLTLNVALEKGITGEELQTFANSVADIHFEDASERTRFVDKIKDLDFVKSLKSLSKEEDLLQYLSHCSISAKRTGEILGDYASRQRYDDKHSIELLTTAIKLEPHKEKDIFLGFIKDKKDNIEEAGKFTDKYIQSKKLPFNFNQAKKIDFLVNISEKLHFSSEEQGNLLKGYLLSQSPLVRSNFLSSYCDTKKLQDGARVIFISSHLADQGLSTQAESLTPFIREMQKPEKIEFLAEYAEAQSLEPKASAELILAYTKSDNELEPTATLHKIAEKRKFSLPQSAELCSASILLQIDKGHKLNVAHASVKLSEFVGELDPQRARRYLIKKADKEGVATDATKMERFGNWFRDVGDRFMGRKTPEEMLFKGNRDKMRAAYTAPLAPASDETRLAASGSVGQPSLTRTVSETLSVSSESTGLDTPSPRSQASQAPKAGSKDDLVLAASHKERLKKAQQKRKSLEVDDKQTPRFPPRTKVAHTGRGRAGSI